jgi:hypothetical protein
MTSDGAAQLREDTSVLTATFLRAVRDRNG